MLARLPKKTKNVAAQRIGIGSSTRYTVKPTLPTYRQSLHPVLESIALISLVSSNVFSRPRMHSYRQLCCRTCIGTSQYECTSAVVPGDSCPVQMLIPKDRIPINVQHPVPASIVSTKDCKSTHFFQSVQPVKQSTFANRADGDMGLSTMDDELCLPVSL